MDWLAILLVLLALVMLGAVVLRTFGAARWSSRTLGLHQRLDAAREARPALRPLDAELEALPACVARHLRLVLPPAPTRIAAATVEHRGQFNMSETGEQWQPFRSRQRIVTQRPGFVWDARIRMIPGLPVHVHDAYVAGQGILQAALAGQVVVAELKGPGEIARGELLRFLAEAAWYPTALLPSQSVAWTPIDPDTARATLRDGTATVDLIFRFSRETGLLESVYAESRGRTVGGRIVPTPWEGHWSDYREYEGFRVPALGEVAWLLPEGRRPYWRGRIRSLRYELEPRAALSDGL